MKKAERVHRFSCLELKQGRYRLAVFLAPAKTIWEFAKINQRNPDEQEGYQRALSPSRVAAIARFIEKGNCIPNNVVLSLDHEHARIEGSTLIIDKTAEAGWVIDGQHRLAGAKESTTDVMLSVVAFVGLPLPEQIQQFVTINREAKGVPTSLYYDLLKHLPPGKSDADVAKEKAADIANELKKDEDSPFYSRIVVGSPKKGQLSLTNFVRKIAPLLRDNTGKLNTYSRYEQIGVINNYYKALRHVFADHFEFPKSTFFRTLGFGAIINALPLVLDLSMRRHSGFTVQNVAEVLGSVSDFEVGAWNSLGAGNQAESQAGEDFREELKRRYKEETESTVLRL